MTPEQFVVGLKQSLQTTTGGMADYLAAPPVPDPPGHLGVFSEWFRRLSPADQQTARDLMQYSAEGSLFHLLTYLDGLAWLGDKRGSFELYHVGQDGQRVRLNDFEQSHLTDVFNNADELKTWPIGPRASPSVVRRFAAVALCVVQLLGIGGAVVAAAVHIESILVSGPLFSTVGLAIALSFLWYRRASAALILFGLSAGAVSLSVCVLIILRDWGPSEAHAPVTILLFGYELFAVPLGLVVLFRLLAVPPRQAELRPWQFNMRALLLLMTAVSITIGAGRLAIDLGAEMLVTVAVAFLAAISTGLIIVGYRAAKLSVKTGPPHGRDRRGVPEPDAEH